MSGLKARFGAFVSRHRNAMVVLGALLVFVTFVINEAIRDNLKDYLESMEQSQSVFELRRDHAAIQIEVEAANRERFENESFVLPNDPDGFKQLLAKQHQKFLHESAIFSEFAREDVRAGTSFLSLGKLLEDAPIGGEERTKIADGVLALERRQEGLQAEIDSTEKLLAAEGTALNQNDMGSAESLSNQVRRGLTKIESDIDGYSDALWDFSRLQYNQVTEATEKLGDFYLVVKVVSYFLYFVGWSFAVVGKLYGVEITPE